MQEVREWTSPDKVVKRSWPNFGSFLQSPSHPCIPPPSRRHRLAPVAHANDVLAESCHGVIVWMRGFLCGGFDLLIQSPAVQRFFFARFIFPENQTGYACRESAE